MALTFRRWVIAIVIGAAAVWLGLFHVRTSQTATISSKSPPEPSTADLAGRLMTQAADRLRLLQIRDSILREPSVRRSDAFTVVVGASYGADVAHELDSLVRERWIEAGSPAKVRTVIAAVLDSSTVIAGGVRPKTAGATSISVFVPDSSAGATCLAILRIPDPIGPTSPMSLRRNLIEPETIGALLGPCLYYATFGTPGVSVARWLRDGAWRVAAVTNWAAPAPLLTPRQLLFSRIPLYDGVTVPEFEYEPRAWTSMRGLACLAGEPGSCIDALTPHSLGATDSLWRRRVVSVYGSSDIVFRMPRGRAALGPSEVWLMSEMVRTVGKDRFGAFWRSNEPVPDAFRSATGQSLDAWVHDWAVRAYGPLPTGPGLARSDVVVGTVLMIAGLAAAAAIARARRVS